MKITSSSFGSGLSSSSLDPPPSTFIWGSLVSESPKNPHIDLVGDVYKACLSSISCHLSCIEGGGGSLVTLLKIIEGVIKVNDKSYDSGKHLLIKDGDELKFDNSAYIFLQSSLSSSLDLKDLLHKA